MGWTIQDPTLGIDVDWEDGDDPNRPPGSQDVWNIAKEIRTPYSLSALPDEVKVNAAKHGFFETPDTEWYSLLFGEMQDDPETEIDETEAGIVQQMVEGGQKFSRQQLFNVTSARRKLNLMRGRLGGETIPVEEDDPNLSQFQEAGKWLRGLQENWESTGPFGEWEPKGADYSQSLGKVGLKDNPTNRRKLVWSALNEDLLQSKIDATQGGAGALMTGPFVWYGGKKFLRKKLMDDADPQSILDYANAAIEFDKTMFYHQEGGEAVANFLGDEEVVNRIQEGTLAADPEMALAYELLLGPENFAGAGVAKLATSPFRIGLKGQVTKIAVGLQDNLAKKIELEAIQASRGIDSSLLVTRRVAEELAEVNAEIAEQQAKLGRYGGKSQTYNLATLGLRKAPGQVLEAAGESLDLATDAGKQAYKMALEATDAAAQRTFSQLVLGQSFRGIGGTVEVLARTLEWVTRVPENFALSRIMAANKAAGRDLTLKAATQELAEMRRTLKSGLLMKTLIGGAGAAVGYLMDDDGGILPGAGGAGLAVLASFLGPRVLAGIGSVGRDMKVIGHEYSLARATDNLARSISKTPTPAVGLAAAEVDRAAALSTEGWFGIPGGVKGATAEVGPHPISSIFPGQTTKLPFREGLDTATEGIEAGAKGEARIVSETTRRVAKFLDDTGLAKVGQVGSTFAGGVAKGTAIPAGIGFLAAGGEWEGALTGAVFSAPFTAIGAGAGTYARFRSKGEVYQKLLGDKAYYRDHLTKVEKKAFDSMSNEGQIAVASLSLSNPDAVVIPVNWGRDGAPGSHQVLKDSGESVIRLNVDSPKSLLYAMRHESMHHLEAHGLRPLVDSILFGDPLTDKVGFFTKLDENKQPVKAPIGEDGIQRWELSKEFYDYKEQYMKRLRKTEGVDPDSVQKYEEDPTLIGREYFSELGSDLMRTGELQKYLDRGPMAKLFGKVVEAMQGREFTKNLLMKFGIPFDSTGKPLVGSGAAIFKDMKRVPELDKLVKKYANQVKNLRKEEIIGTKRPSGEREGGLAPLDFDQEASHAFSVEDIKDPHVLNILNTGGIFAHNPDGSVKEDAMGNPIRVTKKEAENARDPAVDHAISVLEKHGQGHLIETNAEGKKSATIHHLSDAMLDDLAAGPLHPRQVQTLRDIAKALREGDGEEAGMLIGYYSATEGRKPKPVSYAIRKAFPISLQITQGGNILVGLLDVARLQKNLTYLKKHFPAETQAFSNDNAVWEDFRTYAKNLANGEKGETGLTGDVANKKNVLNALLGAMKKEQLVANPILDKIGWKRANASGTRAPFGTGYKTFRLDRIFKSERSGKGIKFNQSARERAAVNYMPRQPDDTIPLPFDELPGDIPGEGFGRMINVDKSKSEIAKAKALADEQDGFSSSGTVRAKNADGRDKLFMPAAEAGAPKGKQAEAAKLWQEKGTDSPFFKKWFGKSKVVEENGEPLVVYHGTDREFTTFDPLRQSTESRLSQQGPGFYFTDKKSEAKGYGKSMEVYLSLDDPFVISSFTQSKIPLDKAAELYALGKNTHFFERGVKHQTGIDTAGMSREEVARKYIQYEIENNPSPSLSPDKIILQNLKRAYKTYGPDNQLAELLQNSKDLLGHDGVVDSTGDATVYTAFSPEQIKSATGNRGTFDAGDPNMLFMPAAEAGAPKGKQAEAAKLWQEKGTDSPVFKKWFGRSKVVNENGEPRVMQHGTGQEFEVFKGQPGADFGFHFGTMEQASARILDKFPYATKENVQNLIVDGKAHILPVYLSIEKPLRIPDTGQFQSSNWDFINALSDHGIAIKYGSSSPTVARKIKKAGYDGLVYANRHEGSGDSYVALESSQAKSAFPAPVGNRGTFDAGDPNMLFMPADRALGLPDNIRDEVLPGIKQDKFSRGQLEAALLKSAGSKAYAEEIGLMDWLKDRKSVTKAEVDQFVRGNAPRLEEKVLEMTDPGGGPNPPKFSDYQEPGGTNYREVLIKVEPKFESEFPSYEKWKDEWILREGEDLANLLTQARNEETNRSVYGFEKSRADQAARPYFRDSHFGENNVLLHLRLNDRIDANGKKVLFIEELQSDWHQKGRKDGYGQPVNQSELPVLLREAQSILEKRQALEAEGRIGESNALANEHNAINARIRSVKGEGVPDAPFKKNWPALGLKRAIREALENGYDRIAWLDGEGQAARYDLSQQVDAIRVTRDKDGTYEIMARSADDMAELGEFQTLATKVAKEKLADYIGKEPASKALDKMKDGVAELSGLDLKVGGEGMKAFYDRELVSIANKISKKIGGGKVRRETNTFTYGPYASGPPSIPKEFGSHVLDLPKNPQAVENLRLYMPAQKAPSDSRVPTILRDAKGRGALVQPRAIESGFGTENIDAPGFVDKVLGDLKVDVQRTDFEKPEVNLADHYGKNALITMADRTPTDHVMYGINDVQFKTPLRLEGGRDYMFDSAHSPGAAWANEQNAMTSMLNRREKLGGEDMLVIPMEMAPTSVDFPTMAPALHIRYAQVAMKAKDKRYVNSLVKKGGKGFLTDSQDQVKVPKFDIDMENVEAFLSKLTGRQRKTINNVFDMVNRPSSGQKKKGVRQIDGALSNFEMRAAISDPAMFNQKSLMQTTNVGLMTGGQAPSMHSTYNAAMRGEGLGVLKVPEGFQPKAQDFLPDLFKKSNKDYVHPSDAFRARMGVRTTKIDDALLKRLGL